MNANLLLDAITASANSKTFSPEPNVYADVQSVQAPFQVHISATATVTLYGRTHASMPWHPIVTLSNSDVDATAKTAAELVTLFPQMYVDATVTSGTVSAGLGV